MVGDTVTELFGLGTKITNFSRLVLLLSLCMLLSPKKFEKYKCVLRLRIH